MKISKYKYTLLIVLSTFICSACTELISDSYSEIIAEQFEPTEEEVPAIIGAAYTQFGVIRKLPQTK
jgi:hypothetical protein